MPTLNFPDNIKILLNVREAAEALAVSQVTVRRSATDGRIQPVRIGKRVLFRLSDLEAFAASCVASVESSPRPSGGHPQKGGVE